MIRPDQNYLRRIACFGVAGMLLLSSCTTAGLAKLQFEQFPILPLDQYQHEEIHEGLAIAIQPITNSHDNEKYFGADLLDSGVLTVFVLAENPNPAQSYLLNKDKIRLQPGDAASTDEAIKQELASRSRGEAVSSWVAPILGGPFGALFLPIHAIGAKMSSNADEIAYHLAIKELQTKMLSPSAQRSGFLYFKLPEKSTSDKWTVHIEALEPTTRAVTQFNIEFLWNRK